MRGKRCGREAVCSLEEAGGGKAFTAHLEGLTEEGDLALTLTDGTEIALDRDKISQVRLHFSF